VQVLSVSYEQFALGLDDKFGQSLWVEFPEIASKGMFFICFDLTRCWLVI